MATKSEKQADKSAADEGEKPKKKAAAKPKAEAKPEAKPEAKKPAAKKPPAKKPAAKPKAPSKKGKPAPQASLALEEQTLSSADAGDLQGFAPAPGADDDVALADDDEDALHDRLAAEAAELAAAPHVSVDGDAALDDADDDDDGEDEASEPERVLSPEEQELAAIYGEEMTAAPAAAAHAEYSDRLTADENRQMLPEINGRVERQKKWEERRDQRRQRRDEERARRRGGAGGADRPAGEPHRDRPAGDRPAGDRPAGDRPAGDRPERGGFDRDRARHDRAERPQFAGEPRPQATGAQPRAPEGQLLDDTGVIRVGNSLGDAAWTVFASIKGAQPMPVRQLAGMMRKRGLLDGDPEVVWPHLKAALLGDERSYKSLGLRPRIVYRGRDLFAPGPMAVSPTAAAEAELARALSVMAVATHRTLKDKIASASQAGFERLAHAYLVSASFRDINWIKRVEGISYATALPPEGATPVLISARSGNAPVDRRGIGELRVGVEAKNLVAGILISGPELSEDAEKELERAGRSIAVMCGDQLVAMLISTGVGVVSAAAPLHYVDDQLLDELLAG